MHGHLVWQITSAKVYLFGDLIRAEGGRGTDGVGCELDCVVPQTTPSLGLNFSDNAVYALCNKYRV